MAATKGISKPRSEETAQAELVRALPAKHALQAKLDHLQRLQDDLLERSLQVVDASVRFAEIDPKTETPPPEWVNELGLEGAQMRLRVARAGWMNAKEAPVGIKVAASVAVGIMKAKAQEKSGPRTLNIAVVQMSAPLPKFETRELEPGR